MSSRRKELSTCRKICAYGSCRRDGRHFPMQSDIKYIPFAKPCKQYLNEEIEFMLNQNNCARKHNTSECAQCSRALKWISLCQRKDNRLKVLLDISTTSYVCSSHFLDNEPTVQNPDPFPADFTSEQVRFLRSQNSLPKAIPTVNSSEPVGIRNATKRAALESAALFPVKHGRKQHAEGADFASSVEEITCDEDNGVIEITSTDVYESCGSASKQVEFREAMLLPKDICHIGVQTTKTVGIDFGCQTSNDINITTFAQDMWKSGWACIMKNPYASFVKYDDEKFTSVMEVRVFYNEPELTSELYIYGRHLSTGSDLLQKQGKVHNYSKLKQFMLRLDNAVLCNGIANKEYITEFFKTSDQVPGGKTCSQTMTVRAVKCKSVTFGLKCMECVKYENKLRRQLKGPQERSA